MAIILKATKTFSPVLSQSLGIDLTGSDYYGVVDDIMYNKDDRTASFSLNIYGNAQARVDSSSVVDRVKFFYNDSQFDSEIGTNGLTVAGAYALAQVELTDWESDE